MKRPKKRWLASNRRTRYHDVKWSVSGSYTSPDGSVSVAPTTFTATYTENPSKLANKLAAWAGIVERTKGTLRINAHNGVFQYYNGKFDGWYSYLHGCGCNRCRRPVLVAVPRNARNELVARKLEVLQRKNDGKALTALEQQILEVQPALEAEYMELMHQAPRTHAELDILRNKLEYLGDKMWAALKRSTP